MNWKISLTIILSCFIYISCNNHNVEPDNTYKEINLEEKSASLVKSSNSFGISLYKNILQAEESEKNTLISPLSISQALSMVWNGAKGETKQQIGTTLAFEYENTDDVNIYQQKLISALLGADKKTITDIANSIWNRKDEVIVPDFLSTNQKYYDAEIEGLDFSDREAAKKIINDWVNEKTRGKIPEIVEDVSPAHIMFLINAVYFYGQWKYKFEEKDTKKEKFYTDSGETPEVSMMNQKANVNYFSNNTFSMVELPYGNTHFNMIILLPNGDNKVETIINQLSNDNWNSWMDGLTEEGVNISIPKFKFECKFELNDPLKLMGMKLPFTDAADFTGIKTNGGIAISKVIHKTFIEVDEKGTEAAAVTSVDVFTTSEGGEKFFKANKPFLYAITEKDTKTILFMGRYMTPN